MSQPHPFLSKHVFGKKITDIYQNIEIYLAKYGLEYFQRDIEWFDLEMIYLLCPHPVIIDRLFRLGDEYAFVKILEKASSYLNIQGKEFCRLFANSVLHSRLSDFIYTDRNTIYFNIFNKREYVHGLWITHDPWDGYLCPVVNQIGILKYYNVLCNYVKNHIYLDPLAILHCIIKYDDFINVHKSYLKSIGNK